MKLLVNLDLKVNVTYLHYFYCLSKYRRTFQLKFMRCFSISFAESLDEEKIKLKMRHLIISLKYY